MSIQSNLITYQASLGLPQELRVKPLALIGFSGLDIVNNAVHKSIWETFNNRTEKAPVSYKMITATHKFPVIKPKRSSYDWYIPKGILKRNWMGKYLQEVPAIIVIFYDLDWKDISWNEKMIECASKVQSMRAALEGRDTRIIVVLIQNHLPIPEDPLAAERAVTLCSSCELNAQSLFVLPHGQHLLGYTIRLENAFFEYCQTYYYNRVKGIKMHKEHLNKNSHQYLYVRHQFKMAFLNELKQDIHSAHKHYTVAYNNLLEIRIVDPNAFEIRTVAGFINYKICTLLFNLNLPRDAISQFKGHIDKFKNRTGFQELIFEQYAWLSKQYEIFGDIFDEAVKLGLPAVQIQHPGIYYQQAAQFAILRKDACHKLCSQVLAYPHPDSLEGWERLEFYGQRPWRSGKTPSEPPDPNKLPSEVDGITALQYLENQINHSSIIISLYGLAIAQYKIYKCPRTRRHLVLQMADECYNSKDFGKALTLFTHMLSDYREEKWWGIIGSILEKALTCAFLTANIQDYMQLALEILGSSVKVSIDEKRRIYENLNRILKKNIPFGDPKVPHDALQNAIILWQPVFSGNGLSFMLDMTQVVSCIEVKSKFTKIAFEIDQKVSLEILVRNTCPFPLTFSRISVKVNTQNTSAEFAVDNEGHNITFSSGEVKKFTVEFEPEPNDVNSEIAIEHITMSLGNQSECNAILKFSSQGGSQTELPELQHFKKASGVDFDNIKVISKAQIVPRDSKISVRFEHAPPALVGECYEIYISILNQEKCDIRDLRVDVLSDEDQEDVEFSSLPSMKSEKRPLTLPTASSLSQDSKLKTSLFLRASKPLIKNISIRIVYVLDSKKPVISIKNETVVLPIVQPFEVTTQYVSSLMQDINKFYAGEIFGVIPMVQFLSPWTICIEKTAIEFISPIKSMDTEIVSYLAGTTFKQEEMGTEFYLATSDRKSDQNLPVADYKITWKRQSGLSTTTQITLHGYHCDWIPLNLKLIKPAHGFVRTPVVIKYHLMNQSSHLVQLDVGIEAAEGFMFSGFRQTTVSIMPHTTKILQYNLYPLVAGNVFLPRLMLTIPENSTEGPALRQDQLNQLIERAISCSMYVMPQAKGNPELHDTIKEKIACGDS
ncbi:trafficking protein particle complex subunit 11 [Anthonomus grandis grandis]|uniref:trafficking protein particle complex subunit 11 n=1 Tax=Anthonomus grandis grandis TaxID=2921223 RepID=UPI0021655D4B|nr:trafficking protein particle complex subunit 11 [Anthonomus grandis grandis]